MQILGMTCLLAGAVIALIASIWWIAECFGTNAIWGYLALFTFPLAGLLWLVLYPRRGWKPVAALLVGVLFLGAGWLCFGQVAMLHGGVAAAQASPHGSPTPISKLLFPQY